MVRLRRCCLNPDRKTVLGGVRRRQVLLGSVALLATGGCTPAQESVFDESKLRDLVEHVLRNRLGFAVGKQGMTPPVVVSFDPTCPHCHNLWRSLVPLWGEFGFVWVPVAARHESLQRGAALLTSPSPKDLMASFVDSATSKELALPAGGGDFDAAAKSIEDFTARVFQIGVTALPFVVSQSKTGRFRGRIGSMSASEYRAWQNDAEIAA